MRYLIQNSIWWIETIGIDGIRMDTYPYAFAEGMAQWMKELDEEYPNFNTVGETWVTEPAYTAAWQKDSRLSEHNSYLKTVMDFSFFDKLAQAKNEETDAWWKAPMSWHSSTTTTQTVSWATDTIRWHLSRHWPCCSPCVAFRKSTMAQRS